MYRHFFTLLLLSAFALARPQTPADTSALAGLPACAQDAANAALGSSGCAVNDKNCICSSQPFIAAITTAVTQTCTAQDIQAALIFGQTFCGAALGGGSSSAPGPAGTATPTSTPSSADDADDYSNGISTTTVPATVTSVTSVPGATDTMTASVSTIPSGSTTSMMPSGVMMTTTQCTTTTTMMATMGTRPTAYNATYTGAAVRNVGQGMMAAAIGVAGAVALL